MNHMNSRNNGIFLALTVGCLFVIQTLAAKTNRRRKTAAMGLSIHGGVHSLISAPVFVSKKFQRLLL